MRRLESQTSTDTLAQRLAVYPDANPVLGLFDAKGDPRELHEVKRDLARCTAQAQRTGRLVFWDAHTMSRDEADAIREWALATF